MFEAIIKFLASLFGSKPDETETPTQPAATDVEEVAPAQVDTGAQADTATVAAEVVPPVSEAAAPATVTGPLTATQLRSLVASSVDASAWASALNAAIAKFGIRHVDWFLAQILHESANLGSLTENLNYSAEALVKTWPSRFTAATAAQYARQPEKIANYVYASRGGNGSAASGDGWRYRGRGPIQLTLKDNYAACAKASGIDCVANPDLVATPASGALAAAWFWTSNKCDAAASFDATTKIVNGPAMLGAQERRNMLAKVQKVLK